MRHRSPAAPDGSGRTAPIRVLLVDDQRIVAAAVSRMLGVEPDIELQCCDQAVEAVARASSFRPSLILQDLVMPDLDGLSLVGLFRANPATARTPVVVLSANEDVETRARALAAGAVDYLVKLPQPSELVACIRRHANPEGRTEPPSARPDPVVLDPAVLSALREVDPSGSPTFVDEVMALFLTEAIAQKTLLREAAFRHETEAVHTAAHTLKGSAMTVGARRLAAVCADIEQAIDPIDSARLAALLSAIDIELALVRDTFSRERVQTEFARQRVQTSRTDG
jgi:DNA-binding response OmpR family regulator